MKVNSIQNMVEGSVRHDVFLANGPGKWEHHILGDGVTTPLKMFSNFPV